MPPIHAARTQKGVSCHGEDVVVDGKGEWIHLGEEIPGAITTVAIHLHHADLDLAVGRVELELVVASCA